MTSIKPESELQSCRMGFWQHLDALRRAVMLSLAVTVGFSVLFFFNITRIFDSVILAPCSGSFWFYGWLCRLSGGLLQGMCDTSFSLSLININLNTPFFIHLSTSFWLGLIASFPLVVYFIWGFFSPAFYSSERRSALWAFLLGVGFFYIGIAVGYFVIFPFTLRFLATYQLSSQVPNTISLNSYMNNFMSLIFFTGLIFEMPLLSFLLSRLGLLHRSFFRRYRRHAVVALLILAALITPADPVSMIMMFIPLYLLYELSALLVRKS